MPDVTIDPPVTPPTDSLFGAHAPESPAELAAALARPAAAGHFDELRGRADAAAGMPAGAAWARFFENLGPGGFADLDRRRELLARQVRDNGVTYNVYADANGPQRPWSLDLFPMIVQPRDWAGIESGVLQRMALLEAVMADAYGEQRLLAANLLPPALVHGHPGYLRAMQGARPAGGRFLHIAAFDLARDEAGRWWVVSQRTQAPSGLGYLLENRLLIGRLFPEAFAALRVQRLAASYRTMLDSLRALSPGGGAEPRIVLLTPGPYNETWFEHAFLARYLGLPLVEGSDLTVRGERLYLKTLQGLEPVHGLLKRLDDEFLDPLELRPDSQLGVPGLMQAIRAGQVLVANAPGSAFLESPALLGFLPALSEHLLGQPLALPSLATWWCGEQAALHAALPLLPRSVIKPTYTGPGTSAVLGHALPRRALDEWAGRLLREPDEHTVQAYLPLSQMPTWQGRRITPRSLLLRVFAMPDGRGGWRVLPGGLTRLAGANEDIASMQRGGSSADTWVMTEGEVDRTTLLPAPASTAEVAARRQRVVTSRAAENLFWLGRYTERAENGARLARLALAALGGEGQSSRPLLDWVGALAAGQGLVPAGVPPAAQAPRVFARTLVAALAGDGQATGVGFNLGALRSAAATVRDRLSLEHWTLVQRAEQDFLRGCEPLAREGGHDPVEAQRVLAQLSVDMAALTGAQVDRMTRDDGWRLLSTGRQLERLAFLAGALDRALDTGALADEDGVEAVLALFDSTITYQALYQKRYDAPPLVDLLVLDRDNPRALGWVLQTLRGRLAKLGDEAAALAAALPDPDGWSLEALCRRDAQGRLAALQALLRQCVGAALGLSDDLTARFFTHSDDAQRSVGA